MDPVGKVAIVSGGASGLGLATVRAFEQAGSRTVVLDRAASSSLPSPTGGSLILDCDVTDEASVDSAVTSIMTTLGRIDICVNCAGIGGLGAVATADGPGDLAAFRRIIDVNLVGSFNLSRHAAYRMIGNAPQGADGERGIIINAASVASFEGQQGMGAYTASKAALAALTLVWARDLSQHHIRCMSIAAGFFQTPMTASLTADLVTELLQAAEFPRRPGRSDEFAELVLFIVRNPYLNAEVIRLDGGTRPPARTEWTAGET